MNQTMRSFLQTLAPFVFLGIAIALGVAMIILLAYVVVWGLAIGLVLWAVLAVKNKFFPNKNTTNKRGITIDHNDIK